MECSASRTGWGAVHKGRRVRIKGFQTPYLAAMARVRIVKAFDLPNKLALPED